MSNKADLAFARASRHGVTRRRMGALCLTMVALVATACGSDDESTSTTQPASTATAGPSTSSGSAPGTGAPTSAAGSGAEPFKVEVLSDLSGAQAAVTSQPLTNGVELAFKEANAAGGAGGRMIEYNITDAQSTPDGAAAAAQAAVSNEPDLVVIASGSGSANAMIPILEAAKLPVVSANQVDSLLFPTTQPWYFQAQLTSGQYAHGVTNAVSESLNGQLSGHSVAQVYVNTPSGKSISDQAAALLKSEGVAITERVGVEINAVDFSAQAQQIVGSKPDLVIVDATQSLAVIITKALTTAGFTGQILGSPVTSDDATLQAAGSDKFAGIRVYNNPVSGDEISTSADKFGISTATASFPTGYVAGTFAVKSLAACNATCSGDELISAMEGLGQIEVPGGLAEGPLSVSADRHYLPTKASYWHWDGATESAKQLLVVDITDGSPVSG